MEAGLIFSAVGSTKSVAEMLGVIGSLEAKVDRLVRSELKKRPLLTAEIEHCQRETGDS
jgi:hypothetical protein